MLSNHCPALHKNSTPCPAHRVFLASFISAIIVKPCTRARIEWVRLVLAAACWPSASKSFVMSQAATSLWNQDLLRKKNVHVHAHLNANYLKAIWAHRWLQCRCASWSLPPHQWLHLVHPKRDNQLRLRRNNQRQPRKAKTAPTVAIHILKFLVHNLEMHFHSPSDPKVP